MFVGCLLSSSQFLPLYPTAKPEAVKTKSQTPRRKAPHKVSVLLVRPSPLSFQRRQSLCQRAARIPGHRVSKEIQRLCVRAKGSGLALRVGGPSMWRPSVEELISRGLAADQGQWGVVVEPAAVAGDAQIPADLRIMQPYMP